MLPSSGDSPEDASRWSPASRRAGDLEVTAGSARRASCSRLERSLASSGAAPISVGSQRVGAGRGRERHRQASVLTKCPGDGASDTSAAALQGKSLSARPTSTSADLDLGGGGEGQDPSAARRFEDGEE